MNILQNRLARIVLSAAAFLIATSANGTLYNINYNGAGETLTATIDVNTSNEVIGISGTLTGIKNETILDIVRNPSFPNVALSPDGLFAYNNVYYASDPVFDVWGILFTTVEDHSGYWNFWGNSPGNYSLFESSSGGYPFADAGGTFVASNVPEPSTWAMVLLGFAAIWTLTYRPSARLRR